MVGKSNADPFNAALTAARHGGPSEPPQKTERRPVTAPPSVQRLRDLPHPLRRVLSGRRSENGPGRELVLPSGSGALKWSMSVMLTLGLLFAPVVATDAASAHVRAGKPGARVSVRHRRPVTRTRHPAAGPVTRQITPNGIQVGVPNSFNGPEPAHVDLVVKGTGFRRGAVVRWDNRRLTTYFVSPTQLTARVPFDYLRVNTLRTVRPKTPGGSGPRGMGSDGAIGTARLRVRNPNGRTSNRAVFTVSYVVVGG